MKIIKIIIIYFQILFIATKGPSYRSDIALDDITFKNQPCISQRPVSKLNPNFLKYFIIY